MTAPFLSNAKIHISSDNNASDAINVATSHGGIIVDASSSFFVRSVVVTEQPAVFAAADVDATLTLTNIRSGIITMIPSVARTLTLDSATNLYNDLAGEILNDSIDFYIVNLDDVVTGANDITLAVDASGTIVGNTIVVSCSTTSTIQVCSGHFRIVFDDLSTPTFSVYRLG